MFKINDNDKSIKPNQVNHQNEDGIWVLAGPRTGSNYLCSIINQSNINPKIREYYNIYIFHHVNFQRVIPYAKVFPEHLVHIGVTIDDVMNSYPNLKLVRIKRNDFVSVAVSKTIAQITNVWNIQDQRSTGRYKNIKLESVPTSQLIFNYINAKADQEFWTAFLAERQYDYAEICYEDLVANTENEITRLFEYLNIKDDVNRCIKSSKMIQQSKLKTQEYQEAYDRLTALLQDLKIDNKLL